MVRVGTHSPTTTEPIVVGFIVRVGYEEIGLLLVGCVHDLESIFTNKLIIPIHEHLHIILVAVVVGRVHNVVSCKVPALVLNVGDSLLREIDAFHVIDGPVHVIIGGVVVNEHDMVVLILLHHDGLHHFDIPIVLDVVVTQNSYAESHLLADVCVLIYLIQITVLLEFSLLDCMTLW